MLVQLKHQELPLFRRRPWRGRSKLTFFVGMGLKIRGSKYEELCASRPSHMTNESDFGYFSRFEMYACRLCMFYYITKYNRKYIREAPPRCTFFITDLSFSTKSLYCSVFIDAHPPWNKKGLSFPITSSFRHRFCLESWEKACSLENQ